MEFSNNNPQNKSLAEIREEAYKQGREDAINTIIQRLEHMETLSFGIAEVGMMVELIEQMKGENG